MKKHFGKHNKAMLEEFNERMFNAWLQSDSANNELHLPVVSSIPFVKKSSRENIFIRTPVSGSNKIGAKHCIYFIEKNKQPFSLAWRSNREKLRKGVGWGIAVTESMTGKVIGALGHDRVIDNERILKGLASNTRRTKNALLDHYDDRLEALQEIESLVNQNNFATLQNDYARIFYGYIEQIRKISNAIDVKTVGEEIADQLRGDIEESIERANAYLNKVISSSKNNLARFSSAGGTDSVMIFARNEAKWMLYELQGINQDITYDRRKSFALTRGVLNDCIENARKEIDDFKPHPANLMRPEHHGNYMGEVGDDNEERVYHYNLDHLSPEREKEIIGAICRIEGWDKVIYNQNDEPELHVEGYKPAKIDAENEVKSQFQLLKSTLERNGNKLSIEDEAALLAHVKSELLKVEEIHKNSTTSFRKLTVTVTPNWRSSVNLTTFLKKIGMVLWGAIQSVLVRTQSYDENPWPEKNAHGNYIFRPTAHVLRKSSLTKTYHVNDPWYVKIRKLIFGKGGNYTGARANDPLWFKPYYFFKSLAHAGVNIFMGFREFIYMLVNKLPSDIYYDYQAAKKTLPSLEEAKALAQTQIDEIELDFSLYLQEVNDLIRAAKPEGERDTFQPYSIKNLNRYPATAILAEAPYHQRFDKNDPVTIAVEGGYTFFSFFTHNFAKNPAGALAFGAGYGFIGGSMLFPKMFSFLGAAVEKWIENFCLSLASGGASSVTAGASMVAQWCWGLVDFLEHGPQSGAVKTLNIILENPVGIAAGIGVAKAAGQIAILTVPVLQEDAGTNKDIYELIVGGKLAVLLTHAFQQAEQNPGKPVKFKVDNKELALTIKALTPEQQALKEKIDYVHWLAKYHQTLSKLSQGVKHIHVQHIDRIFKNDPIQANALKKLFFPVYTYSIAHQLITIPLGYIPAVFVLIASFISSALTSSTIPMRRAGEALGKKILKDLSRLIVAAEKLIHLGSNLFATGFKIPTYLILMLIGRIASLFGARTGHDSYKAIAAVDVGYGEVGDVLYPERAYKFMGGDEHSCSALLRQRDLVESTTKSLMDAMPTLPSTNTNGPSSTVVIASPVIARSALCDEAIQQVEATTASSPGPTYSPSLH